MLESLIYGILFFSIPVLLIILLGISIYRYSAAKKANKASPETYSKRDVQNRKIILIIASVLAGAFLTVVIGFTALMFLAVAFM